MSYLKIGKYGGESLTANTYTFEVSLPTDYVDVSDVYMWFEAQNYADMDYTFCRNGAIGYIMNNGGFSACTDEHKLLLVQNFCVDKATRDSIISETEQEFYWELFVYNSEQSRKRRWEIGKSFISYRLPQADSSDLGESTDVLTSKYLRYDIKSLASDGKDGLYDWIKGEGNFTSTGFPSKSYYTEELRDGLIDRLEGLVITSIQETPISKIVKPSVLKKN